jgi:hypothetical protein
MNYKKMYLESLKKIKIFYLFRLIISIQILFFYLLNMNLLLGYFSCVALFYLIIKDTICNFLTTNQKIRITELLYSKTLRGRIK